MDMVQKMGEYLKSILESPKKIKKLAKQGILEYNPKTNDSKIKGAMVIRDGEPMYYNTIAAFLENDNNEIISLSMQPEKNGILIATNSGMLSIKNINLNGVCLSTEKTKKNAINICEDCKKILETKQNEDFTTKIKQRLKRKEKFIKGKSNKKVIKNILIDTLKELEDMEKMMEEDRQKEEKEKLVFDGADPKAAIQAAENQINNGNEKKEIEVD